MRLLPQPAWGIKKLGLGSLRNLIKGNELNSHNIQNSVPDSSLAGDGGGVDLISPR